MTDHVLVVDCSAFAYRAYYSLPALRRESDGEPMGAVLGFMSMIWRLLGAAQFDQPTHAIAVFDAPGKNFRHKLFPDYKGNRDPARSIELEKQLPLMRPVANVLGLTPVEYKGFEADDVIATIVHRARLAGIRSTIVSSDKDFGQLVVDPWIAIYDPMQRGRDNTKSAWRLEADILAKFGVVPALVPDVQALAGDTADGIPGVKGIGPKTAAELVRRFGSLDGVLKRQKEIRGLTRAKLARGGDKARLYLKLTTLRRNVPLKLEWDAMRARPIVRSELDQIVKALDPNANVSALFGLDLQDERVVERDFTPLAWWREELVRPGQMLPAIAQCGYYQRRLTLGGVFVPARIWREPYMDPVTGVDSGLDVLRCEVGGRARDPQAEFARLSQQPIKESDYKFETADFAHAKAYRPGDPKASPEERPDITKYPPATNPRKRKIA